MIIHDILVGVAFRDIYSGIGYYRTPYIKSNRRALKAEGVITGQAGSYLHNKPKRLEIIPSFHSALIKK